MSSTTSTAVGAFKTTLDLFETGLGLMRQNLRRAHPEDSLDERERRLGQWIQQRPGAEFGDCPGRQVDIGSRLG